MDQVNHEESYVGPSVQPAKRRRGRPRKQLSIKPAEAVHPPPGFERAKEHIPPRADSSVGVDHMIGQAVTGVIEATFDAGYLLSVKIGNSNINLRGVVFKPGHYIPITAGNDVAPNVQMIRRNDAHPPAHHSRRQNLAMQLAGGTVPSKRKYGPPKTDPSVPSVGARGTVVPVVLQPVNRQNGLLPTQMMPPNGSQTANMLDFGDKDVHMVEPISMLPPCRSIPAGQIFANHSIHQLAQGSINGSFNEGTPEFGQVDKDNATMATEIDTSGSSQSSGSKIENSKEASPEDSGILSKHETGNTGEPFSIDFSQGASVTKPLFNYVSGRMTELLQAVQDNMKDNKGQTVEQQPIIASEYGFRESNAAETDPTSESNVA